MIYFICQIIVTVLAAVHMVARITNKHPEGAAWPMICVLYVWI